MISKNSSTICLEEHSTILNTLCHECLSTYLKEWAKDKPSKIKNIIHKELEKFNNLGQVKGEICIVCNKSQIICCPYCIIETLYEKLRDNSQNKLANSLIKII